MAPNEYEKERKTWHFLFAPKSIQKYELSKNKNWWKLLVIVAQPTNL